MSVRLSPGLTEWIRLVPNRAESGRPERLRAPGGEGKVTRRPLPDTEHSAGVGRSQPAASRSCHSPVRWGYGAHFMDEETEAPRGFEAGPKARRAKKWWL